MAIITIARERGAHGRQVARALADRLGAHFIDRDIVESRLETLGIKQKKSEAFDERKPGFFASLTNAVEEYVTCLKLVLFDEARDANCVVLGRGGQMLFREVPGHLSVRLIAPAELRSERVAETEHLDLAQARQVVSKVDHNRAGFNSFFFDCDWADPLDYDMVFNTRRLSVDAVVGWLADMARSIPEKELADGREMLANLARAQKVERHLLHVQKLPVFFLKVTCDGDKATLTGIAHSADVIEQARRAAFIDGIQTVNCKIEIGLHGHYEGRI